mmetsp:Transcript_40573/g.39116  ORF Transcript_40573/g.39116 Transcript_40573/m.39116 type:complete len:82 (+) Transcript_40573:3332-3577(+)
MGYSPSQYISTFNQQPQVHKAGHSNLENIEIHASRLRSISYQQNQSDFSKKLKAKLPKDQSTSNLSNSSKSNAKISQATQL